MHGREAPPFSPRPEFGDSPTTPPREQRAASSGRGGVGGAPLLDTTK